MTQNHAVIHVGSSPTIGTNDVSVRTLEQFFYKFNLKICHEIENDEKWKNIIKYYLPYATKGWLFLKAEKK